MKLKLLRLVPLLAATLFSGFFTFYRLGENYLIEYDEGIYGLVAKNILRTGDWFTLHWKLDFPWFDKGPLYLWLTALSLKIFGFQSLAVRFWSAIFGLVTVIGTFFLGRKLYSNRIGFIAALILSSTTGFVYYSRLGMLDVPNAAFNVLSLLFLVISLEKPRFLNLAALVLALGFLNRGPLAFFGLASFLICLFPERLWQKFSWRSILLSLGIFLVAVAPWHVIETIRHGANFWEVYLGHQVLTRFTQTIEGKAAPIFWYVTVARTQFRIWFLPLLPAVFYAVYRIFVRRSKSDLLVFLWVSITFFAFTLAQSKLIWYILPLYPGLSLIVARFLDDLFVRLKLAKVLPLIILLVSLFYNFRMWSRIQTRDFSYDQVKLIEHKNRIDPTSPLLSVIYGYSVSAFYSISPVTLINKEELGGFFRVLKYKYAIISLGDLNSLPQRNDYRIIYSVGDGALVTPKLNE